MIKLKKILFVIESLCDGGAERVLSNITMHFPPDWHIDILVNDESLIKYPYKGNILSLSKPCQKLFIGYIGNILNRLLYLRKLKKNNDYMACISFLDSSILTSLKKTLMILKHPNDTSEIQDGPKQHGSTKQR